MSLWITKEYQKDMLYNMKTNLTVQNKLVIFLDDRSDEKPQN